MTWSDTFSTALEAVRANRVRSVLTMLGILIGIAAVTLTVGLGQGAQAQVREQIDALGSNLLIVSPGSTTSGGVRSGRGGASTLTTRDAAALADADVAPDVARVAPVRSSSLSVTAGTTNWTTTVAGTTDEWLRVRARSLQSGRFLTDADVDSGAQVAVLGPETASELFGRRPAVGQTVVANGSSFTVVGVLEAVGATATTDEDDQVLVPLTTAATRLSTGTGSRSALTSVYLEASSPDTLSAAYQEATAALLTSHGLATSSADFTIASQQALVETATATDRTLTVLLAGVAGISLLVGGIGVMNIMLVSVSERVREIGLRKALGATPAAVRRQFLLEASTLGLGGGVLGLALGLLGAAVLPGLLDQPVAVSPVAAALALAVALVIGITAGVYPAGRAARLAPIDALRND